MAKSEEAKAIEDLTKAVDRVFEELRALRRDLQAARRARGR